MEVSKERMSRIQRDLDSMVLYLWTYLYGENKLQGGARQDRG